MTKEIWKPVVGCEKIYEISNIGRLRRISTKNILQLYQSCVLKGVKGSGHRIVHKMVLEAFVGPRPKGMVCCHLDNNGCNNKLGNLKWGTMKENMQNIPPETKHKLNKIRSINMKGNKHSFGKKHSVEACRKKSKAYVGSGNPFYGKHHSKKAKKKISQAMKGRKNACKNKAG